ncbi:YNFM family putative membrane transporter [Methylobacterium sp. PvP062]|jgi:YNFM family putative membrane transporter|uniref:YNFM family putative membrane transporter n=1 Tax=Methylobacterium radiotolerans TaxID=31998 RepID=A0ABV2NDU1_9HYPH|nr:MULTISPECIES: MFS transporter [Methylobacterium]MCX7331959.1 MFS transporter [Hyphomicrobiales bacterium]GAN49905.1 major facilitator transporter [Methylobacterium sp. ME121]MBN6818509.1 MFS transporter [Methylobacterium organophilum]MBP2492103.1 YNFM family putative membrane transporter [Methylobacterium sp. PvP105]MBP2501525.1 YNFM family putative membrane transporter [Methylobacterium sp. PvP109]
MDSEADGGLIRSGTPVFRRTALALAAAGFSTFAVLYAVQPLLPIYADDFGVSPAASSLALSLPCGLLAVALLVVSPLSEIWGRKPVMLASLVASALLTVVAALVPGWYGFLALRALTGLTASGLPAVAMAYLAEEMDAKAIGLSMGLLVGGNALGGMSGRLISGVMADFVSWRAGLAVIGGLALAAALAFWRWLPPSRRFVPRRLAWAEVPGSFTHHFRDAGLPWLFAEAFLLMGGFVCIYNYIGFRLLEPPYALSQAVIGLIFSVYLAGMVSSPVTGELASRFGRRRVLWVATAVGLAGIVMTLSDHLLLILAGIVVTTVGFFGAHAVASSWVGRRALRDRAQASAIYLGLYYLGSSVLGTAGGWFFAHSGWNGVVLFVGGLYGLALTIALRLSRLPPLAT